MAITYTCKLIQYVCKSTQKKLEGTCRYCANKTVYRKTKRTTEIDCVMSNSGEDSGTAKQDQRLRLEIEVCGFIRTRPVPAGRVRVG